MNRMLYSCKGRLFFARATATLLVCLAAAPGPAQSPASSATPAAAGQTKPDSRKARKAYERGQRAEQAGNWHAAFDAYAEAATYAPDDTELLRRREAARFQIVQRHTDRAEREALAGRFDEATAELRAALKLDPGYSVARERLAQFERPQSPPPAETPAAGEKELPGPVRLQPQPGTRDFNHRGDTRSAYQEVAREFGVIASFDTDLPARPARLRVNRVDFATAMIVLGQQTNTFWRPLDERTFFVAENSAQKRREYAPEMVRTIVLPVSTTPERMTEIARLVREIAGVMRTDLDTRTHTLTLRDTPENVAVAVSLVHELEQAPAEFMLEIEILEVNSDTARRLGITPPSAAKVFSISTGDARAVAQAQNLSQVLAIIQRIFGTAIPPVMAFGGGKTIFLATLPGAVADFRETFSLVRSGRRMLLRAQDGQPATFFVGERFPVALATLGSSLVQGQLSAGASQVAFPRSDFATGNGPVSVVTADFDGDGRLDLAVVNTTDNTVSILLGNGDGTFQPHVDYKTGTQPVAVAVGDFNADGHPDLVVANKGSDSVSILLNNGKGTFPTHTEFAAGTQPVAVAVGEFNADGHPDLAVANEGSNNVSILLGNTTNDGTFKPHVEFAVGTQPSSVAIADFNADGHPDLAVANQGSDNSVSILLGNTTSDGTFQPHVDYATGNKPVAVVIGDFNADARPDLAVANQTDNGVSILLGRGDGTFDAKRDFGAGTGPAALATADFNGDNRLDLAVANQTSGTATILLGNGDGTFGTRLDVSTGSAPSSLVAVDFNGNGLPDLAIANQNSNSVTVILNTATLLPAQRGLAQTAYPGAEYEDLGLKVRATPRVHPGSEVTLQLQFEIRSLSGVNINGIPVISNRTIEQTVRLRENETTVLSGIVQANEARTITGLPGFAHAGRRETQKTETELLIVLTPRRLREAPHTSRSIYAGRGEGRTPTGRSVLQ